MKKIVLILACMAIVLQGCENKKKKLLDLQIEQLELQNEQLRQENEANEPKLVGTVQLYYSDGGNYNILRAFPDGKIYSIKNGESNDYILKVGSESLRITPGDFVLETQNKTMSFTAKAGKYYLNF